MSNCNRIVARAIARKEAPIGARHRGVTVYLVTDKSGRKRYEGADGRPYSFGYVAPFRTRPYTRPEDRTVTL